MARRGLGGGALALMLTLAASARGGGQAAGLAGYISKDRVVEMAAAADPSVASFVPATAALESFVALVDPVHVRMFICPARPADLVLGAKIGRAVEASANPALTLEFVAVSADLSEPKALIDENAVTAAPEIIVYWLGEEVGRMHPEPGAAIDADLAGFIYQARTQIAQEMLLDNGFFKYTYHKDLLELDCKRCHGPGARPAGTPRRADRP